MILKGNSMKSKMFLFTIITYHILSCAAFSGTLCESGGDFIILRQDVKNRRLFIKSNEETIKNLDAIAERLKSVSEYIEQCKPEWNDKWSISLFTEKKYASYKDDKSVRLYVMDGTWQKNYLAEYSHRKKLLTRYPLDPKKRMINEIKIGDQ